MRIQQYDRAVAEPSSSGALIQSGAGTAELASSQGLAVLSQATEELAQRAQDAQRTTDVMVRTMGFRQQYGVWWARRSAVNTGFQTLATESDAKLAEFGQRALKGIEDPLTAAAIQSEVYKFSAQATVESRTTAVKQQIDWSRAALEDQVFMRRQEIGQTQDPLEKGRLVQQTADLISKSAQAGFISPLDGEKKLRAFVDGVAEDELQLQIYQNPDGVLRDIYSGAFEKQHGAPLSEDVKQRLILNAEKRSEALRAQRRADQRRADQLNDKRETEVKKYNSALAYEGAVTGNLTTADIHDMLVRGQIDNEGFTRAHDKAVLTSRMGGPGNPDTTNQLRRKAYRGELSFGELIAATDEAHGINKDESQELELLLEKGSVATRTRDYKAATDYLTGTLHLNPISGSGTAGQTDAIAALAERELYERVVSDPNADPMKVSQEIVERFNKFPIYKPPAPRFPSLQAAQDALIKGAITGREFDAEAAIWHMQRQPKAGGK